MGSTAQGTIPTWEVLRSLGFIEDTTVISDPPGGLSFDFRNLKLTASVCTNLAVQPVIQFGGVLSTGREIGLIEFQMPQEVESWEQGLGWLTFCLDQEFDDTFQPRFAVAWRVEGRQYRHLLPWERKRAAYDARPLCYVDRDWARVALRKLAEELAAVDETARVTFHFDGEVVKIRSPRGLHAMPASGVAWKSRYALSAGSLRSLPKRLMHSEVTFSIWDSALTIGNCRYAGVIVLDDEHP